MKQALFWSGDEYGCGWFRTVEPARGLRTLGWDAEATIATTAERLAGADVLVGQRVCKEAPTAAWHDLIGVTPLVWEIDDDVWNMPAKHPARPFYVDPGVRRRISANVAVSDLVTVSTDVLAEVVSRLTTAPVVVIPNALPAATFELPTIQPRDDGVVRIGYTSSITHAHDVAPLRSAAQRLQRRYGDRIEWVFYGFDHSPTLGVPGRFVEWDLDIPRYHASFDFDIGIAPLQAHDFNRAKSPLKAQEYGARGIPVVASNFGPYASYVEHGYDGLLVDRPSEFEGALIELIEDEERRLAMGKAAYEKSSDLTTEDVAHQWDAALRGVM